MRPRLIGEYVRDEASQASELIKTLGILDAAGVDGAFVSTFAFPIYTYDSDARYDLDIVSTSLVQKFCRRQTWESLSRYAVGTKGVVWSFGQLLRHALSFHFRHVLAAGLSPIASTIVRAIDSR